MKKSRIKRRYLLLEKAIKRKKRIRMSNGKYYYYLKPFDLSYFYQKVKPERIVTDDEQI